MGEVKKSAKIYGSNFYCMARSPREKMSHTLCCERLFLGARKGLHVSCSLGTARCIPQQVVSKVRLYLHSRTWNLLGS